MISGTILTLAGASPFILIGALLYLLLVIQ